MGHYKSMLKNYQIKKTEIYSKNEISEIKVIEKVVQEIKKSKIKKDFKNLEKHSNELCKYLSFESSNAVAVGQQRTNSCIGDRGTDPQFIIRKN